MPEIIANFPDEIDVNKNVEEVSVTTTEISNDAGSLSIRNRGCFIVDCELTSTRTGDRVKVLYADSDIHVPKLTASHVMMPVGPSKDIGGQHGFPRWADFHEFAQNDGPDGEKRVAFQAMRSDSGLGLTKVFELTDSANLSSDIVVYNSEAQPAQTSLGEHFYFALAEENSRGLAVNGQTLDELLGEDAERDVISGKPLFWSSFNGQANVDFPAGHTIRLSAKFAGDADAQMGMLVWHRPGSPSICFEPTIGFDATTGQNDGVKLAPYTSATLSSKIELL